MDIGEEFDVAEIGSLSGKEGELGFAGIDVGGNDDDATSLCWGTVRHGRACGYGGGDEEGEEAAACAVVAVEEGEAAFGDTMLPEPVGGFVWGIDVRLFEDGVWDGLFVDGNMVEYGYFGCYLCLLFHGTLPGKNQCTIMRCKR